MKSYTKEILIKFIFMSLLNNEDCIVRYPVLLEKLIKTVENRDNTPLHYIAIIL